MTELETNGSVAASNREASVVVRGGGPGLGQEITAGGHLLMADEPIAAGGTNTGPNPYDLLLSALGACTSITVRMYARRKGWLLEEIVVRLSHSKIHAEDCFECFTETGLLDRIDREIELTGPLTPEQRLRLLDIAEKCPVSRTLASEINIRSWLK
jgi:uncharacterized OsmC-like protein